MPKQYIHIVMTADIILEVYARLEVADAHARTVLGAVVVSREVRTRLPDTVLDDIVSEEYGDEDTVRTIIPKDQK